MRGEAPEKRQAKPAQAWHRAVPGAETGARQQRHLTSERVALRQCATAHPPVGGGRTRTYAAPGGGLPLKTHSGAACFTLVANRYEIILRCGFDCEYGLRGCV